MQGIGQEEAEKQHYTDLIRAELYGGGASTSLVTGVQQDVLPSRMQSRKLTALGWMCFYATACAV